MKSKLLLSIALIGMFQLAQAQFNVHANGQLTNTNAAPIDVWLTLFDGGTTTSVTAITDVNGYYSHTFIANTNTGSVYMQVQDCNFDSIFETQPFDLINADTIANFTTFDYCPVATTTCQAYFSVNQAAGPNGLPLAGTLAITDSSTSSNPAGLTYTWDFGDGTTGTGTLLNHTYSGNGPYLLCLTINDGLGCVDTFCDTISVDSSGILIEADGFTIGIGAEPFLGITNTDFSSFVNIYPNPAVNYINVDFNSGNKTLNRITMYDLSGKLVYEENTTANSGNTTSISTENIQPGTYLIQMLFDNELYNQKVIIK